jgi:hypothetical protein
MGTQRSPKPCHSRYSVLPLDDSKSRLGCRFGLEIDGRRTDHGQGGRAHPIKTPLTAAISGAAPLSFSALLSLYKQIDQ